MRAWTVVLCLGVSATPGCASHGAVVELRDPASKTAEPGAQPAAPSAPKQRQYAGLERQLHMIAERRLDVGRDQAEGLFAEIQAQRMLAQAALEDAASELRRRRAAELEDPALRRLRALATVSHDARGTVVVLPCLRWFSAESAELSAAAKAELAEVARALTELNPNGSISIEALPDARDGGFELSQQRALSVRGYLIGWGIGKGRLTAWSRGGQGDARPQAQGGELEIVLDGQHAQGRSAQTP